MPTLAEVTTLLSRYAGSGNSFNSRLNEVRARLLQSGNWKGSREQIELDVYADADGNSIVTLPPTYESILTGAIRSAGVFCSGLPMGVRSDLAQFNPNGLGYGGLTANFDEVPGRYAVFQEWEDGLYIRLKFEATESSGVVHLHGQFDGDEVYSLYSATWIKGEKVAFSGSTTATSTKKFEAKGFNAVKPITNGRISVWVVDDDGIETQVGLWEPTETVPRRKRYKVPECEDAEPVTSENEAAAAAQSYTIEELDALFNGSEEITVSTSGTTDLAYSAFFLRRVKIIAAAGAGAYVRNFTLNTSNIRNGAIFRIKLEIAQSANPVLNFYNESTGGTLLQTVSGDSSNPTYVTMVISSNGTAWSYDGREI